MKTHRSVVVLMNNSGDQLSGGKSSNSSGNEDDVVDDKSAINDKITSATSSKQSSITTTTKAGPTASTAKATKTSGDGDGDSNDSDGGNKSGKRKKKKKKKTNNRMQYRSSDGSGSGSNTGGGLFPVKLHDLLTYAENHGLDKSVISWTDDGRAFIVHDQDKLVETLLPLFFGQTKYRSFHRQLNMWSFERVSASSIAAAAAAAAAKAKAKAGAGQQQLHMVNVSSAEHHSRKQIIFQHPFFLRGQKAVCQHMNREIFKTHPLAFGGTTSNSYSSASGSQRPPSPSSSSGSKRKYPIERKVHPASNDATAPLTKTDSPPTKKDKKMSPSKRCPHKRTTTAAGPKRTSSTTTTMASTTDNNNNNSGLAMLPLTMRTFDQGLGGGGGDMSNLAGQPFFFLDMDLQQQQQLQQQQLLSTSRSSDGQQQQLPYRRPMVAAAAIDAQAQHDSIQSAAAASLVAQQHQANSSVDTTASVMASNEAESRSAGSIPFTANFNVVGGTSVGDVHLSSSGGGIHNASMPMGSTSFNQADVEPNPIFESQDPTRNAAVAANNQGQQDGGSSQFQAFGMPLLQAAASIANMNAFVNSPHQSMRLDHHHPHHHQLMLCTTTSSANASGAPLTIGHSTLGGDGDFVNNAMLTASASQAGPQAFISFNSNVNINNAVQSLNHTMSSLSAQQLQALNTLGGNPIAAPASDSSSTAATSTYTINSGQMDSDSGYFSHHGWHQSHKG